MANDGSSSAQNIHVLLIPFLARSHVLTMVDTARLFGRCSGVRCTIVTTQGNSSYIEQADEFDLQLVPFPSAEVGLPVGIECTDSLPVPLRAENFVKFYKGMQLLQHPINNFIVDQHPDIILFDHLLFWFADIAESHSIPFFLLKTMSPFQNAVFAEIKDFLITLQAADMMIGPLTALPHPLEFTASEVPKMLEGFPGLSDKMRENIRRSCGTLFDSFEELTPQYVDYCRNIASIDPSELWCIGPVHLVNDHDYTPRISDNNKMIIQKWLDLKRPESVLYVSFGSECVFSFEQLREIALGLQSCEHSFVWVVRGKGGGTETMDEWLPQEFHNSVGERGLIVTEWVPQFAILNHPATGGFMTHCGWRSTLEAVSAGLPVIPWPLHSEQFINERLLVEILRVGVRFLEGPSMRSIDVKGKGLVKASLIKNTIDRLLGGADEEARAMRQNASKYKALARSAMAKGGSSYANLNHVIEKMKILVMEKQAIVKSD